MRRLLSLLAVASLTSSLVAQSARRTDDTVAYTTATIRMREKPSPTAREIAILAQGTRVRLYHCSEGWCGISVQRLAGYALEEFLSTQPAQRVTTAPAPPSRGGGYTNVDGERVPSPTRTADGQPPPGASAKCRDGTFSFSRHRQGTCSHHGGVAQWL